MFNKDFIFLFLMVALALLCMAPLAVQPANAEPPEQTRLFLVSVGNGDPDNITLRAVNTIKASDIVFCKKRMTARFPALLSGKEIHDPGFGIFAVLGKTEAEFKNNRRFNYNEKMEQYRKISAIIRKGVKNGKTVSVLCSGDPSIYGPNMWYTDAFKDLSPEIVPGVSCFNAANAALKKGVTSGKNTHSVILTASFGREEKYKGPDSIENLAALQSTMVFFTMFMDMEKVVSKLKTHYPGDTPAAIVQHAGYRNKEKVILGTLDTILSKLKGEDPLFEYMLYVGNFLSNDYNEKQTPKEERRK